MINLNRLSTRFVLATILLFSIAGGATIWMSDQSLEALVENNGQVGRTLSDQIEELQTRLVEGLSRENEAELRRLELDNRLELAQTEQEILSREMLLRGRIEGALRIMASQLESVLGTVDPADRDFFEVDTNAYKEALHSVHDVKYLAIVDEATLADVAAFQEFTDERLAAARETLNKNAGTDAPHMMFSDGVPEIRIFAMIGPPGERYGMMEVVIEDEITPLREEMQANREGFEYSLEETSVILAGEMGQQVENLKKEQAEMQSERAAREATSDALAAKAVTTLITVVVVSSIFGAFAIGVLVVVLIVRPLGRNVSIMKRLAENDTDVDISDAHRSDEIGDIARAVEVFRQNAIDRDALQREQESSRQAQLRAEEEQRTAAERRGRRLEELNRNFEARVSEVLEAVSSAATQLRATAEGMQDMATRTATQTDTMAQLSRDSLTSIGEVAQATDRLRQSIRSVGDRAGESMRIADDAVGAASNTKERIQGLVEAAQKIEEVVELITAIAEQTNLLALNATIEAARAGDAGKGFAVVATEVKSLADQTARATEDIANQVTQVQAAVGEAADGINGIAGIIEQISGISTEVAGAVKEQSVVTEEIANGAVNANSNTEQASGNVDDVRDAAGMTQGSSDDVVRAAEELARQSETLKRDVTKYLSDIQNV